VNDKAATLIRKVEEAESQGLYDEAQAAREKLLVISLESHDIESIDLVDYLAKEQITIRGVEAAEKSEWFYSRLNSLAEERLGPDSITTAHVKRKLGKVFYIQSRLQDAISMVEAARSVFAARLGKNDNHTIEAVLTLMSWHGESRTLESQIFLDWVCREYPICEHLQPLEKHLKSLGLNLKHDLSYHGRVRIWVDAWLDLGAIQNKLKPSPSVKQEVRSDIRDGSFRGFVCSVHEHGIEGRYDQNPEWPNVR